MSPGPDFAIVAQNTLRYSRNAGIYTALGIGAAILIHMTYCALGLAVIITHSTILFSLIAFIGGGYLVYSGINALTSVYKTQQKRQAFLAKKQISNFKAFKIGFLTNLLNPKAILFFLAIFSFFIKQKAHFLFSVILAIEIFIIDVSWFCFITYMLSHKKIEQKFSSIKPFIIKLTGLGLLLIGGALIIEELIKLYNLT